MKKTILLFALVLVAFFTSSAQFNTAEYLDINKIKARYMVHGDMFWDPIAGAAAYEFPKGSGKHSGFASSLWIGGYNQATSNLHIAAQTYRNRGNDYWPGPLDVFNGATSDTITSANWSRIWKVDKSTIDYFRQLSTHTLTNTPQSILDWPSRGANSVGGAQQVLGAVSGLLSIPDREMAPFVDINSDNIYNPLDGDYPDIKGEQMLWWVFNDNTAAHTQSGGLPIKVEIHASAYACNQKGLDNTTFLNYRIFNFNSSIMDSTVITFWNDIDLGYAFDDFIGFDSIRRMGITYNGDPYDETGIGYGSNLTQKAAIIIKQPGDGPNHRSPIGAFTYFNNSTGPNGDPTIAAEYYNYMTGSWKNGDPFRFGCAPMDTTQAITKYCFPDDPSISNGISEVQCNRTPFDRRFLLSSKPFSFIPGTTPREFTFALINTDTGVDNSNFNELRRLADSAYKYSEGCQSNNWPLNIPDVTTSRFKVYPNPANSYFTIEDTEHKMKSIQLYNVSGQAIYKEESNKRKMNVSTEHLPKGLYFLRIEKGKEEFTQSISIR